MTFFADMYTIYIRSIKQAWRPLASLIPPFFIPIFFFIVNSAAFKAVSQLPGFTADSYLQFQAPVALFMSVFFSSGNAGIELVLDMSTGFFDKLLISPIQRLAIILGTLESLEESKTQHLPIEVVLTLGEEAGLLGAINLDYSKITARQGVTFDGHEDVGNVTISGPGYNSVDVTIKT